MYASFIKKAAPSGRAPFTSHVVPMTDSHSVPDNFMAKVVSRDSSCTLPDASRSCSENIVAFPSVAEGRERNRIVISDIPVFSSSRSTSCIAPRQAEIPAAVPPATIHSYFKSIGAKIISCSKREEQSVLRKLDDYIARHYETVKEFLYTLRTSECFNNRKFYYKHNPSADSFQIITGMTDIMANWGMFSEYYSCPNTGVIHGTLSSAPRVINYINGEFAENIAGIMAENTIKRLIDRNIGLVDYEILYNVFFEKNGHPNELDMVIRISCTDGETLFFWGEVKSGKQFLDYDKFRKIGISLQLHPNRHILLHTCKDEEDASAASFLYQFYVSNLRTFEDKMEQMIINANNNRTQEVSA